MSQNSDPDKPALRARKPGRPRKVTPTGDLPLITRQLVLDCAYQLADTVRLEDVSLEMLARKLGVSATTIRHHTKNRKALTSALIESYFRELHAKLPPLVGDWKVDLDNYLWSYMALNLQKRGFASYFFEHRFSPELDPFVSLDARAVYLRVLDILKSAGLNTVNAALAWHLIIHLLLSIAYAEARGQTPASQASAIDAMVEEHHADPADRAVLVALRHVNLPMIYGVISNMLKNAIAVKFDFPAEQGATPPGDRFPA